MAAKKAKVGDAVLHHGRRYTITALPLKAVMVDGKPEAAEQIVFENDVGGDGNKGRRVKGNLADFKWSKDDDAWYGVGRLLCNDERIVYEALMGVRPPPETHLQARMMLDLTDLAEVPMDRLAAVIERRVDLAKDGRTVDKYAADCLAHCVECKEARNG